MAAILRTHTLRECGLLQTCSTVLQHCRSNSLNAFISHRQVLFYTLGALRVSYCCSRGPSTGELRQIPTVVRLKGLVFTSRTARELLLVLLIKTTSHKSHPKLYRTFFFPFWQQKTKYVKSNMQTQVMHDQFTRGIRQGMSKVGGVYK